MSALSLLATAFLLMQQPPSGYNDAGNADDHSDVVCIQAAGLRAQTPEGQADRHGSALVVAFYEGRITGRNPTSSWGSVFDREQDDTITVESAKPAFKRCVDRMALLARGSH